MDDDGKADLESNFTQSVKKDFPNIELIAFEATPDKENRRWKLKAVIKDKITGIMAPLNTNLGD